MSGVILRVRVLSSSPRSLYAAWKMILPDLPLSTSILFTRQPCLAFKVLFFAAAWLMPLISEPPDMTYITRSCRGGETGAALVGFLVVSLLRWILAFSEKKLPEGKSSRDCLIGFKSVIEGLQRSLSYYEAGRGTDRWSVPSTVLVSDQPEVKKCKDRAPVQQEERRPEL
ncbi:hypothetical protein F2Q69_00006453 [Brassica cretica]|uniref:Uncharacterized protein n=1 Tax=Brassica cretica TaxID=69181 RepID=A0A8S9P5E6_BRACR|nr:hypothetical protein F2Q69_00006453 [Brassica cretica]